MTSTHEVIVIGGGHAGVEAAWAAANLYASEGGARAGGRPPVALVTIDPAKIGVMSCNPAIGGLAKGQLVREIDALNGLMPLAADATGIHFKVLNTSKGPAVRGPRCQNDKHAYAECVRALVASRAEIEVVGGTVERLLVDDTGAGRDAIGGASRRIAGVSLAGPGGVVELRARAVILTTGTFMRGLMHTGTEREPGGRRGEASADGISGMLRELGFELGRLRTGTTPRLKKSSIDWAGLEAQPGDALPVPFSDLSGAGAIDGVPAGCLGRFPAIEQVECRQTRTTPEAHELLRANLERAPMFNGQADSRGPRYCPSIEDKVVRFADRSSHGVFLEPESLRTEWVYCNGIATSMPRDVQERVVRMMPGCADAEILAWGYTVEYDMVRPHQISATGMTKTVGGLFFAGQINGTSGYEEAAAQGLVAGVNAVRFLRGEAPWLLGRDEAYIGVLMDDLVTKTPVEPYRMFTSRAEFRLLLRADNAADRLGPVAERLGLLGGTSLGAARLEKHRARAEQLGALSELIDRVRVPTDQSDRPEALSLVVRRPSYTPEDLRRDAREQGLDIDGAVAATAHADRQYAGMLTRQAAEVRRHREHAHRRVPRWLFDWVRAAGTGVMRNEARQSLLRFTPETFGQASRLEGITPADLTLMSVIARRGPGAIGGRALGERGAGGATPEPVGAGGGTR